jgi:hypothetical protein
MNMGENQEEEIAMNQREEYEDIIYFTYVDFELNSENVLISTVDSNADSLNLRSYLMVTKSRKLQGNCC